MGFLRSGFRASEGHLGTSLGGRDMRVWEGHSEAILGPYSRPYLRNLIITPRIAFIWPWVGLRL